MAKYNFSKSLKLVMLGIFWSTTSLIWGQQVAFTFDDAPKKDGALYTGLKRSEILIRKLGDYGVTAAFFVNSKNMDDVGKLRIKMYGQEGHVIANHTHSHPRIEDVGVEAYIEDIKIAHEALKDLPGFRPWFRYPFLDEGKDEESRDAIRKALEEMGYFNGYVTVDNYDYYLDYLYQQAMEENKKINYNLLKKLYIEHLWESLKFYEEIGRKILGRSPQHVLLLHENDLAALFMDDLITYIRGEGWEIISPQEAYRDPIAKYIPDVLMNNQGRLSAIAREDGWDPNDLVQPSESEAYLRDYFSRKKVFK